MLIGYARVSKADGSQLLVLQRDALIDAGVMPDRIYEDRASGRKDHRPGLDARLKALRPGNAEPFRVCRRVKTSETWEYGTAETREELFTGGPRAVRMVFEHQDQYASQWQAIKAIAGKTGCHSDSLREWVKQAEIDQGAKAGVSSEERARIKELEPKFAMISRPSPDNLKPLQLAR